MYLRITNTPKGQYLTICEKYRDRTTGKRKDIYVRKIGYASEYASQYSDPIAHFREVAAQMTADKGNDSSRSILIDLNDTMDVNEDSLRNVGYSVFKRLYLELELPAFWCKVTRGMNIEYDADGIF